MTDRSVLEGVTRRIRALLNKTVENGATEEEMLSAAAKAAEMMQTYNVTLTDAEVRTGGIVNETFDRSEPLNITAADQCHPGLEALCGVRIFFHSRTEKSLTGEPQKMRLLAILGLPQDVEFAHWLYDMIDLTIERAAEAFKDTGTFRSAPNSITAISSFQLGMATRINQRLQEIAAGAQHVVTSDGKALVPLKGALVEQAYEELRSGAKKVGSEIAKATIDTVAYGAGAVQGNSINLSRPIESTERARLRA